MSVVEVGEMNAAPREIWLAEWAHAANGFAMVSRAIRRSSGPGARDYLA